MTRRTLAPALLALLLPFVLAGPADAQDQAVRVRGVGLAGSTTFASGESFDAIFGSDRGRILGGGAQVLLPAGVYVEVVLWRFTGNGERVFIGPNHRAFRLGIPVALTITPIEVTGGWRFERGARRIVPYAGAGWSSYGYEESSTFADADENVTERFGGVHVVGGVEVRARRWLSIGGEVAWSRVPNALGDSGVAAAFGEDDLGGLTARVKITIGQ